MFLLIGGAWIALEHLVLSQREKTDDAYVTGNQVRVSSQLAGTVVEVFVRNTSRVKPASCCCDSTTPTRSRRWNAPPPRWRQTVRQVRQQQAQSSQYDATDHRARAGTAPRRSRIWREREPLLAEQAVAGEEVRHARDAVALAQAAACARPSSRPRSARALVDDVPLVDNPAVLAAARRLPEAWLALQRTRIVAPIDGFIAQRSVQLGQRIAPGEPLMTIIPLQDVWLEANFKEGQLRHLRIGQPATHRHRRVRQRASNSTAG